MGNWKPPGLPSPPSPLAPTWLRRPGESRHLELAGQCPGQAKEGGCVHTHVCKCLWTSAHACTSWEEPSKKKRNEMTMSKARCPGRKQREMKGRGEGPPTPEASTGGRPPDGCSLWEPSLRSHCSTGAKWLRGHIEWGLATHRWLSQPSICSPDGPLPLPANRKSSGRRDESHASLPPICRDT